MKIGIIPAAGRAERFGGTMKDLLPLGGQALIKRTYDILNKHCDQIVIVTNEERIEYHAHVIGPGAVYLLQENKHADIFGAIHAAVKHIDGEERYYFSMPDTVIPEDAFDTAPHGCDFALGTFQTTRPERFGVIRDRQVVNKNRHLAPPCTAWGVLVWSKYVAGMWKLQPDQTYTQAINGAMKHFGFMTFELKYYYDVANEEDYYYALDKYWEWRSV